MRNRVLTVAVLSCSSSPWLLPVYAHAADAPTLTSSFTLSFHGVQYLPALAQVEGLPVSGLGAQDPPRLVP